MTACGALSTAGSDGRRAGAGPPSALALRTVEGAAAGALSRTAAVTVTLSQGALFGAPGARVPGSGVFDFSSLRGAITFAPPGVRGGEPVVFTPTAVYVRPPSGGSPLPPGKSWTVADFSDPEALTSNFPKLIAQAEGVNPALLLSELVWGSSTAADAGSERVAGRDAASYDVTLDLSRTAAAVSGPAQVPFSRAIATEVVALGGSADGSGRSVRTWARVWVAGDGRLVRVSLSPPGIDVGTVTITLSAAGAAVVTGPPPSAQVVDILTLGPSGERENSRGGDSDGG